MIFVEKITKNILLLIISIYSFQNHLYSGEEDYNRFKDLEKILGYGISASAACLAKEGFKSKKKTVPEKLLLSYFVNSGTISILKKILQIVFTGKKELSLDQKKQLHVSLENYINAFNFTGKFIDMVKMIKYFKKYKDSFAKRSKKAYSLLIALGGLNIGLKEVSRNLINKTFDYATLDENEIICDNIKSIHKLSKSTLNIAFNIFVFSPAFKAIYGTILAYCLSNDDYKESTRSLEIEEETDISSGVIKTCELSYDLISSGLKLA